MGRSRRALTRFLSLFRLVKNKYKRTAGSKKTTTYIVNQNKHG